MTYEYSISEWLLFFYIYCFIGWCIESTFVSVQKHKFVNRGFMRGPFLPLYGSGAVLILFATIPFRESFLGIFLSGAVAASVLEYVTGVAMEAIFKVRYWDYSNNKFNLNGHICLGTSIAWGFLSLVLVKIIHAPIEKLVLEIPEGIQNMLSTIFAVYLAADFALSFKAALDITNILVKMQKAKEELERVQAHLNDMIASFNLKEEESKQSKRKKISETLQDIRKKLEVLQTEYRKEKKTAQFEKELEKMKEEYVIARESRFSMRERLGFYRRSILKSHPTISSRKFKEALMELKEISEEKKEKKKK